MRVKIGNNYTIKCGWGKTNAKLEYITDYKGRKQYNWRQLSNDFGFVSYDLKDTKKYVLKGEK